MSRTRFNPRLVKINFNYTVEEVASLLGIRKETVRDWLKAGLETIDDRRPALILGKVLRDYLQAKRTPIRRCPPGTMYCVKCRTAKKPALGMIDYVPIRPRSGNLRAICEVCGTLMHRSASKARIEAIMPNLEVRLAEAVPRLLGSVAPSLHRDSERE